MHEHHRHRADPGGERGFEIAFCLRKIERREQFAACANAFVGFDYAFVEQFGQDDRAREEFGTVLIGDAQCIGKAAGGDEQRTLALALEQRVGGDRGAHFHCVDQFGRNPAAGRHAEQLAYALHRGIPVALRVFREQFVGDERTVRLFRDDVGERASAVDPELPFIDISH